MTPLDHAWKPQFSLVSHEDMTGDLNSQLLWGQNNPLGLTVLSSWAGTSSHGASR